MSNDLVSLNEDHVRQLGRIIETLERSTFDFLQIEVGDLKVTVGKGNIPAPETASPAPRPVAAAPQAAAPQTPAPQTPAPQAGSAAAPAAPAPQAPPASEVPQQGTVEIKSPIMGMFYAQPEPGAPAFVTVGATVGQDTTVALVEVMKTFNAVTAGVNGKVVEICAQNGQLVEYGQVLFRVVPE
jgi:acetyl-CoA carboxylase biotin carboxyl carrier protein